MAEEEPVCCSFQMSEIQLLTMTFCHEPARTLVVAYKNRSHSITTQRHTTQLQTCRQTRVEQAKLKRYLALETHAAFSNMRPWGPRDLGEICKTQKNLRLNG